MPKTREQKRQEAEARALAFKQRTPEQQLALIAKRPGKSEYECAKIRQIRLAQAKKKET